MGEGDKKKVRWEQGREGRTDTGNKEVRRRKQGREAKSFPCYQSSSQSCHDLGLEGNAIAGKICLCSWWADVQEAELSWPQPDVMAPEPCGLQSNSRANMLVGKVPGCVHRNGTSLGQHGV